MKALTTLIAISYFVPLVLGDSNIGLVAPYKGPFTPTKCYGSRQDQFPVGSLFAAVNEGLWDSGAACGRLYKVRCISATGPNLCIAGATITVKVIDGKLGNRAPTLSLSPQAAAAIYRGADCSILNTYKPEDLGKFGFGDGEMARGYGFGNSTSCRFGLIIS